MSITLSITLATIGFLVAWVLLLVSVFKGHSPTYMALVCSIIVLVTTGQNVSEGIMGVYMGGLASLAAQCLPLILMGAIMGQIYTDSGAATSIAFALSDKLMINVSLRLRKTLTIALIYSLGCLLCYGGVDSYAMLFTLIPLTLVFFEAADIPRKYAPAVGIHTSVICLGGVAAPTFYNIFPSLEMGTTPKAGLTVGVIALVINVVGGILLTSFYVARDEKKGQGGFDWGKARKPEYNKDNLPNPIVAVIPLLVAMILFIVLNLHFVVAIGIGVILSLILFHNNFLVVLGSTKNLAFAGILTKGATAGVTGAMVTCSMAAFGAVAQTNPMFAGIVDWLVKLPVSPVIMYAIMVAALGFLICSTIAGFRIGLNALLGIEGHMGLPFEVLHRVGAQTASAFNLAPYTGVVFVSMNMSGLSPREGYSTILKIPGVLMISATIVSCILYTFFPALP